jgi:hypothetical protein
MRNCASRLGVEVYIRNDCSRARTKAQDHTLHLVSGAQELIRVSTFATTTFEFFSAVVELILNAATMGPSPSRIRVPYTIKLCDRGHLFLEQVG